MTNAARLTIDLDALAHNYRQVCLEAQGAQVAPVIKADGYGLGVGPIARRLSAEGARTFFVARLSEGQALRRELNDREASIVVLDGLTHGDASAMKASRLTPALTSLQQIKAWAEAADTPLPCYLHFDTGMNRLGLDLAQAAEAARLINASPNLRLEVVMSHLSCAAQPDHPRNLEQLQCFHQVLNAFPGIPASLSASAGAFLGHDFRFDMVRPGICLFGGGPRETPDPSFRAVAILQAPVLQIRHVGAGQSVGYGKMFTAPKPLSIAILGAGYADGVLRALHDQGFASLNGKHVPFVIVTMDMIGVDITHCGDVQLGDMAELLGPNVLLDDVAAAMDGTVAHEVLVRLSQRAHRTYRSKSQGTARNTNA